VNSTLRQAVEQDAKELAKAVLLKSVEQGWPDKQELDQAALGLRFGHD
jgi:hypothetical protein